MSMTSEELEKTGVLKVMLDKDNGHDEDITIGERIEELEDRLEYIDIDDSKKDKIINLLSEVRKEENNSTKEFLYNEILKLID